MAKNNKEPLADKLTEAQMLMMQRTRECQDMFADLQRVEKRSVENQLKVIQLEAQRDVLLAALADTQRRNYLLRAKNRPCSCGSGVNEHEDETGMPLTDRAAERL